MKKLLIFLGILFSSFIIIDKVGATSVTAYYDSDFVNDILERTDLDHLNNDLIPFINSNFQNYFVVLTLSNPGTSDNYTIVKIYILPRNTSNNGATFMRVQNGYTNQYDFFPYTTIDSDYVVSGRVRGYQQFTYRTDTNQIISTPATDVIPTLTSWLSNPTYGQPNNFLTMFYLPQCPNSSCNVNFLDISRPFGNEIPYYINYPSIMATTLAYQDYQGEYIVNYRNRNYAYDLGDPFPTYYRFYREHSNPFVFDLTRHYDSFNHLTSVDLKVTVYNYNSNYTYQYKVGDEGLWQNMNLSEVNGEYVFNLNNFTINDNIFFRAIDPNNNNSYVASSTFQITGITTYKEFNISNYNGEYYCNGLLTGGNSPQNKIKGIVLIPKATEETQQGTIYFSVPSDFTLPSSQYIFGYSKRSQTLSDLLYFNINSLYDETPTDTTFTDTATYIDNFSKNNYNIYYFSPLKIKGYNNTEVCPFADLKPLIISFDTELYEYQIINEKDDLNTITDPNTGNTYILDSNQNISGNGNQEFLNNAEETFAPNSNKLKQIFNDMWNGFKNLSGIGTYFLIVIGFSVTLWLIKAFKR